uniref:Tripartite motif-containing protein 75 n=1 Tax=Castor canadensis TaxID=51338 RepID=A0A8B7TL46_CASCN|nr:putative tripartite motif-containing protein 75 [Castor canadensis]
MEVTAALVRLQTESKCPICLEELTDPITTECGHNFCQSCIQRFCANLQIMFPCPVCRHRCKEGHTKSNTQLGRMIEMVKQLHINLSSSQETQKEIPLCEKHNEGLTLFCEEDLELLCPLCIQLPAHQRHHPRLIKEAASYHREMLYSYMESLNKQVEDTERLLVAQDRKKLQLRKKMKIQSQKLFSQFDYMKRFVECEQQAVLSRLVKEEGQVEQKLEANKRAYASHISTMEGLLTEMVEKSVMPEVRLLTHIKSVFHKVQSLKPPAVFSFQLKKEGCRLPPQFSALQKIQQKFRKDVTLDPETAHPNLLISEDKKCVTFPQKEQSLHGKPMPFMGYPAVLGSERFSSGRHYWEVQVDDKPEWMVGVCKDFLSREGAWPLSGLNRCWTVQLQHGEYVAQGTVPVTLCLTEKPRRIGIYLDYELDEISFYNLNDTSHIHTFMDTFFETLKPYFCVGCDSKPLTICSVTDSEG